MRIPESTIATLATERGLKETTLRRAGITRHEAHPYEGWWEIPYPHRTGVWKRRYKNPNGARPKYKDEPGAKFHLYNPLQLGPNEEEVWFAEGEFDTLCLVEIGVPAIGIHGVSNVGDDEQGGKFRKEWALLFEDTLCVTAFDRDEQGVEAGRRLASGLKGEEFDDWDARYTDLNDWYRGDPEGFRSRVAGYRGRTRGLYGLA